MAEAKQRMGHEEFINWIRYRNTHGSLRPGHNIDQTLAVIATIFASAYLKKSNGQKWNLTDFLVSQKTTDKPQDLSPDRIFSLLKGLSNGQ